MKAQIISLDFLIAVSVFAVILFSGLTVWNDYSRAFEEGGRVQELKLKAYHAGSLLFDGLLKNFFETGIYEMENFTGTSYNSSRNVLGLEGYDFRLTVRYANGSAITDFGEDYGLAGQTVSVKRFGFVNGKPAVLRLVVWEVE